ncbi:EpsG family protein [Vibrio parahaemolyticus]|uniref:EpsG family protein n=1 Tax=Vibrio parahaemolyticus TaxID=670 RepID=UPI00211A5FDE|nr:EpsG family protein [Vibrio parahaemolyticus]MCQ9098336.1 EpsG family protein [Vibrio parahaemolyticus]MDL2006384.1 EpsG family protein [Vibrio parahaemolyticus]HCG6695224.1 EpsG family protein [Vibrio parahaemolyticus]
MVVLYVFVIFAFLMGSRSEFKLYEYVIILIIAYLLSSVIVSRDIFIISSGYGYDVIHYLKAFEELIMLDGYDFIEINKIGLFNTGSSEVLFWQYSYLLSVFTDEPRQVWFLIVFNGIVLLYLSLLNINKFPIFIMIFLSSITFWAYAGSAIRQFAALFMLILAVKYHENKKVYLILILSCFIHLSFVFITLLFLYIKVIKIHSIKMAFKHSLVILIVSLSFGFISNYIFNFIEVENGLSGKLASRLADNESGYSWLLQYIIESLFFVVFCFVIIRNKAVTKLSYFSMVFLILFFSLVVGLSLFSGISDRLYRYSYLFYLLIFTESLSFFNAKVRVLIGYWCLLASLLYFLFLFDARYLVNYNYHSIFELVLL